MEWTTGLFYYPSMDEKILIIWDYGEHDLSLPAEADIKRFSNQLSW